MAKCHARAEQIGIKEPVVCASLPEARALFAEPILHVTDEDAIVHDRSATFFKIAYRMVRRVLIVGGPQATIELLREHILSMFPHVAVDLAFTAEDALNRMTLDSSSGAVMHHEYDIVIADEHCYSSLEGSSEHKDDDSEHPVSMTGSQLLKLINDSEANLSNGSSQTSEESSGTNLGDQQNSQSNQRRSLMIGVSTDMSEDCESLIQGGADLLWSTPPKPSNCLRNQLLNTLLSKRGKSVFICGC